MTKVHGRFTGRIISWFDKNPLLSNQYCPYCGVFVGASAEVDSDKEHLIGRNFVPKGTLESGGFNFIFRSCRICNARKANAERHISTVTLFNSPSRAANEHIDAIARHKASRDYHPAKKGVLVKDASDQQSISFGSGGFTMQFGSSSPPQIIPAVARLLACNHVQALFALITTENYRIGDKLRILPASQFLYFSEYSYRDWGNPQLLEIVNRVQDWPCYANIDSAGGYFKAMLRGLEGTCGFWALEWNQFLRVVGAISLENERPELFEGLPDLGWKPLPDGSGRFREEVPLLQDSDILFSGKLKEV